MQLIGGRKRIKRIMSLNIKALDDAASNGNNLAGSVVEI
jgi:hypothetical protein